MIRQTLQWGYCDVPSLEGLDWARSTTDMATIACRIAAKQLMPLAMPLSPDQLPDDLDALERLVVAKDTELEAAQGELTAIKPSRSRVFRPADITPNISGGSASRTPRGARRWSS
jgi:hypothetical protein